MPKVSIILTSFNHDKYLNEAIDSVLGQTFTDFELIIWDDASSDNSWHLIRQYSDPRIKAFHNDEQKRGAWGINKAISEVAAGEYIAIHHSDDIWEREKLEKQVKFIDDYSDVGAVFTRVQVINEKGDPFKEDDHVYSQIFDQPNRTRFEWLRHFFYFGNCLCHPSVMVRKSCYKSVGLYDRRFAQICDLEMWVRLCMKYDIYVLEMPLTRFRVRANEMNQSGNKPETHIRSYMEFQQVLKNYLKISSVDELRSIFPDIKEIMAPSNNHIPFLVAIYAAEQGGYLHRPFAINTLYELFQDSDAGNILENNYHFSFPDLIKLTGTKDCSRFNEIASLKEEITRIKSTYSWRMTKPFRFFSNIRRHFQK
ncbi:MAG: glycosyltransferase [Desulfobacterales bacterium]|nr:glycosyltransferase [Desulfobacterales bacterium]